MDGLRTMVGLWAADRQGSRRISPEDFVMTLHLAVSIKAKAGKEAALRAALEALVGPSRAEDGCLLYDLHTDNQDPAHLFFYEAWATEADWHRHNDSPHIARHRAIAGDLVDDVKLWQLTKL
jgi:quinol monooxygenase YgiN